MQNAGAEGQREEEDRKGENNNMFVKFWNCVM
jgi:hypothetical protein